jgi:hypothetical protein
MEMYCVIYRSRSGVEPSLQMALQAADCKQELLLLAMQLLTVASEQRF